MLRAGDIAQLVGCGRKGGREGRREGWMKGQWERGKEEGGRDRRREERNFSYHDTKSSHDIVSSQRQELFFINLIKTLLRTNIGINQLLAYPYPCTALSVLRVREHGTGSSG